MKVLWVTNVPLPEASTLLNQKPTPFGGWLINASMDLSDKLEGTLFIAFPIDSVNGYRLLQGERIKYLPFLRVKLNDDNLIKNNVFFEEMINEVKPDIVHIFGTEYPHTLSMVNICNKIGVKTVISIQGLVSIYSKHYMANVPESIQKRYTIRDFIKRDNLKKQQIKFMKRGLQEIEAIMKSSHVIGRTTWDKACSIQINPQINYHFCNETLRDEFYHHQWSADKCEKYSIFASQASYPIKGIHYLLEAMPLIIDKFPKAKLYIAGYNILKDNDIKNKLRISSYGKYIKELIKKYKLEGKVFFTGVLNEKEICERYLVSNVFVCPSSIENSPNSLGEAMILGVPCVASNVGGVSDMLRHNEEGFVYQADAPYMLAYYICKIFEDKNLTLEFSTKARKHALITHNKETNTRKLIAIYKEILSK